MRTLTSRDGFGTLLYQLLVRFVSGLKETVLAKKREARSHDFKRNRRKASQYPDSNTQDAKIEVSEDLS